jgi:hypothetical protein
MRDWILIYVREGEPAYWYANGNGEVRSLSEPPPTNEWAPELQADLNALDPTTIAMRKVRAAGNHEAVDRHERGVREIADMLDVNSTRHTQRSEHKHPEQQIGDQTYGQRTACGSVG